MDSTEIVKRLREYAVMQMFDRFGRMSPMEKSLLSAAADLIEQLEMDLENTRRCLGDVRVELQDREEDVAALKSDLDSTTRLAILAAIHIIERRLPCETIFVDRSATGTTLPLCISYEDAAKKLRELGGLTNDLSETARS